MGDVNSSPKLKHMGKKVSEVMDKLKESISEKVDKVAPKKESNFFYKGYDIRWLRKNPDHPDFYLVAEFDSIK